MRLRRLARGQVAGDVCRVFHPGEPSHPPVAAGAGEDVHRVRGQAQCRQTARLPSRSASRSASLAATSTVSGLSTSDHGRSWHLERGLDSVAAVYLTGFRSNLPVPSADKPPRGGPPGGSLTKAGPGRGHAAPSVSSRGSTTRSASSSVERMAYATRTTCASRFSPACCPGCEPMPHTVPCAVFIHRFREEPRKVPCSEAPSRVDCLNALRVVPPSAGGNEAGPPATAGPAPRASAP